MCSLLEATENLADARQVALASKGEADATAMAMKQCCPESIFEIMNLAADGRLLNAKRSTCLAKAAMLRRSHEIAQMSKLYGVPMLYCLVH
ncbi:hypothetical protein B30_18857 [Celeribacter baekdonensis B30]|uniref:Uncharacterized protein n=1 Tax=Celeribacter baekdonensis B30 TaxID=1208323 RepID=K2J092_9RHOB|nr:hypothetical protein B30_18857 [Celeribacter baekdonensis B30]